MMRLTHTVTGLLGSVRRWRDKPFYSLPFVPYMPSEPAPRPAKPWTAFDREVPADLRTVPGVWRDPEREDEAFRERPVHTFFFIHHEARRFFVRHQLKFIVPTAGRFRRALERARRTREVPPATAQAPEARPVAAATPVDAAALADRIRALSAEVGLSQIGFAAYDERYTFAESAGQPLRGTVIVCLFEQDWEATQTIPSLRAEKAAVHAYAEVVGRSARLADHITSLGYEAHAQDHHGPGVVIHYAVQAGLGQLGLNGQLLTPAAGSRCRISVITTNLPVPADEPRDFGLHRICDECQACVRRCPTGAITSVRREYRGVTKAKIRSDRCFPVVAQVAGCAVCMKVCPVQRYGLDHVLRVRAETGEIAGLHTGELEGYVWPLDRVYYGPGEKPRESRESLLNPPGWYFDKDRVTPVPVDGDVREMPKMP